MTDDQSENVDGKFAFCANHSAASCMQMERIMEIFTKKLIITKVFRIQVRSGRAEDKWM